MAMTSEEVVAVLHYSSVLVIHQAAATHGTNKNTNSNHKFTTITK